MDRASRTLLFSCLLLSLFSSSSAQTCRNYVFSNNNIYTSCNDLPVLNSFLHWTYDQSAKTMELAFRHTGATSGRWIAWAINPTTTGMVGSQALVAVQNSTGGIRAYTSPVTTLATQLEEGPLIFGVSGISATNSNNEMTIYATLQLSGLGTTVNQVWQEGPMSGDTPSAHAMTGDNRRSTATVDLLSGQVAAGGGGGSTRRKRNVHGVLNAVSWGTLLPLGAMIARYLKVFKSADPVWFYIHVACQTSAYIVGVAGWATGIKLGSDSVGLQYDAHRNIGITLFCLGTLQVFALLLRPKKDHKYRLYWSIYHHSVGYAVISLSIVNIFKGFDILDPEKKWKKIYIAILIFLGSNAALLEAYTWYIVIKRKKAGADKYQSRATVNGSNGVNGNGHGNMNQQAV